MTPLERGALEYALARVTAPYVWQGKGLQVWSPSGLVPHRWPGTEVYDCSGLVTSALRAGGGPDWRATHSAQTLHDALEPAPDPFAPGVLRLYGTGPRGVSHVALSVGHGVVVEAGGGDSRTVSPAHAARQRAMVRVGFEVRRDVVGARLLPALPPRAA